MITVLFALSLVATPAAAAEADARADAAEQTKDYATALSERRRALLEEPTPTRATRVCMLARADPSMTAARLTADLHAWLALESVAEADTPDAQRRKQNRLAEGQKTSDVLRGKVELLTAAAASVNVIRGAVVTSKIGDLERRIQHLKSLKSRSPADDVELNRLTAELAQLTQAVAPTAGGL